VVVVLVVEDVQIASGGSPGEAREKRSISRGDMAEALRRTVCARRPADAA
jgi:hypothetical protein